MSAINSHHHESAIIGKHFFSTILSTFSTTLRSQLQSHGEMLQSVQILFKLSYCKWYLPCKWYMAKKIFFYIRFNLGTFIFSSETE